MASYLLAKSEYSSALVSMVNLLSTIGFLTELDDGIFLFCDFGFYSRLINSPIIRHFIDSKNFQVDLDKTMLCRFPFMPKMSLH